MNDSCQLFLRAHSAILHLKRSLVCATTPVQRVQNLLGAGQYLGRTRASVPFISSRFLASARSVFGASVGWRLQLFPWLARAREVLALNGARTQWRRLAELKDIWKMRAGRVDPVDRLNTSRGLLFFLHVDRVSS